MVAPQGEVINDGDGHMDPQHEAVANEGDDHMDPQHEAVANEDDHMDFQGVTEVQGDGHVAITEVLSLSVTAAIDNIDTLSLVNVEQMLTPTETVQVIVTQNEDHLQEEMAPPLTLLASAVQPPVRTELTAAHTETTAFATEAPILQIVADTMDLQETNEAQASTLNFVSGVHFVHFK